PTIECFYGLYKAGFPMRYTEEFPRALSESPGPQRVEQLSKLWTIWHAKILKYMNLENSASVCQACRDGAHWDQLVPALLGFAPEKLDEVTAAVLVSSNSQCAFKATSDADAHIVNQMDTLKTQGLHTLYKNGNYGGLRAAILNAHNEPSTCKNPSCHAAPRFHSKTADRFAALFRMNPGLRVKQAKYIADEWDHNQFTIEHLMSKVPSGKCQALAAAVLVSRNPSLPSRIKDGGYLLIVDFLNTEGTASDAKTRLISNRLSYLLRNADEGLPRLYNINQDNDKNGLDSKGLLREILEIQPASGPLIKSCQDEDRKTVAHAWTEGRQKVRGYLGLTGTSSTIRSCHTCDVSQRILNEAIPASHEQANQHRTATASRQPVKPTSWESEDDDLMTSQYFFDSAADLRNKVAAAVLVTARPQLPTQILGIQIVDEDVWTRRMMFLNELHILLERLMKAQGLSRSYERGDVIPLLEEILVSFNKHDSRVEEILAFFDLKRPGSAGSDGTMTSSSFTIDGIPTPSGTLSTSGSRPASPLPSH
ncbi:hypothetical protein H0H93_006212, partial [Arthromyces matolae]